jgi:hypothetical protein
VIAGGEEVGVDLQRDAGVGVTKLTAYEHHIEAAGD